MAHVGGGHALKCFPTPLESFQGSWHSAFQDAHPAQLNNRPAEHWVEHSFGQSDILGSSTHVNVGGMQQQVLLVMACGFPSSDHSYAAGPYTRVGKEG